MILRGLIRSSTIKRLLIFSSLICLFLASYSQAISIRCTQEPLNRILMTIGTDYRLMFSFDDGYLSSFSLSIDKTFQNVESALDYLLTGLPLKYEEKNGVFIIYKVRINEKPRKYIIAGRITDKTTDETLPFSGIQINGIIHGSDSRGSFSYSSLTDSVFRIRVSHLGYYILDTIAAAGINHTFPLMPSVIGMKEIIIKGSVVEKNIQAGSSPGTIRLNHKIAYFLPGNGDNSIFNLLRLQPGILASGEQSKDLIIWGSYEGQSQVLFDRFTIYGMKNFNDNISAVNPYMAKDIKVLKGGYDASYGERVGAVVDIAGADGNRLAPAARFCINNMTMNGLASVPLTKNSTFILAYRQTYYNLYNPVNFSASGYGRGQQNTQADFYLTPDYYFRDINIKYSAGGEKSDFYLSLYGGNDRFSYDFDKETMQRTIVLDHNEKNIQMGGSLFYGLRWKDKNTSNFILSFSSLHSDLAHNENITRSGGSQAPIIINDIYQAEIEEINLRAENTFILSEKHFVDAGFGTLYYFSGRDETTLQQGVLKENKNLTLPCMFLQDHIGLSSRITLIPGVRLDYHSLTRKIFLQPRFSLVYRINDQLKFNAAIGRYNQFIAKNRIIDASGNYRLAWSVSDGSEVFVLDSKILTTGLTYYDKGFTVSAEGYLKTIGGITRYLESENTTQAFAGDCKIRGLDLFIKKDFRDQTFWISYTLSKALEYFPYFPASGDLPANQDQRHELKMAAITKFKSLHFSVNYVFGSGFPDPAKLPDEVDYAHTYSRLDAALIYEIARRKVKVDAGISVLNVLNRENIRYSNYTRIPADETTTVNIYAEAVPFTPSIFLNIYF